MPKIKNETAFAQLIAGALQQEFSGWDFSYLDGRWSDGDLPWDYRRIVLEKSREVGSLLEMGTGGGELMSSLAPFPPITFATESYAPNVPIAQKRLASLGCQVIALRSDENLPFDDEYFDLVINRHETFSPRELYRVLRPGGSVVTQQVGGRHCIGLTKLLQQQVHHPEYGTLDHAVRRLEQGGLRITYQQEAFPDRVFYDIGAIVYYLKVVSFQMSAFTVAKYRDRLAELHNTIQDTGQVIVRGHYFFVKAEKE
jgi:SAM-dependent methyltransferase